MAILGILLGMTMTVLGGVIYYGRRDRDVLLDQMKLLLQRVSILECRKAVIAEAATSQPKPVGGPKMKRWTEDLAVAE